MAHAPTKHSNHDDDEPVRHAPPAKVVGEAGSLIMPVAAPAGKPTQTIGVKGEPLEDGARDPDTIAEEQRRRSAEYEAAMVPPESEGTRRVTPPPVQPHEQQRHTETPHTKK